MDPSRKNDPSNNTSIRLRYGTTREDRQEQTQEDEPHHRQEDRDGQEDRDEQEDDHHYQQEDGQGDDQKDQQEDQQQHLPTGQLFFFTIRNHMYYTEQFLRSLWTFRLGLSVLLLSLGWEGAR